MTWEYDAGEPYAKKKHGWPQPHAGVKKVTRGKKVFRVGCCPSGIQREQAEILVNGGMPYFDDPTLPPPPGAPPDRFFLVHDGVPYEARWTMRGKSLHAFPVLPELYVDLPNKLKATLEAQARTQGYDVGDWLKEWKP